MQRRYRLSPDSVPPSDRIVVETHAAGPTRTLLVRNVADARVALPSLRRSADEDVVVSESCRGKGVGQTLVRFLVDLAKSRRCYKVVLDCAAENCGFYEKCGFVKRECQMRRDC